MCNVISYLCRLHWIERPEAAYADDDSYVYCRTRNGATSRYFYAHRDAVIGCWAPATAQPKVALWHQPSWQAAGWRPTKWSDSAWCYTLLGCNAAIVEEISPSGLPEYTLVARTTGLPVWGDLHWHVFTEAITSALAASTPNEDETNPFSPAVPLA